ncbi:hypothetical protein [Marinovum algicola]|uniref:hypothetical protein n=2 Tax=Roseobacteraceae TaxID=2854170 RepID=UPI0024BAF36D|nr:hypothetical protein [Marinovum algicola]
MPSGYESRRPSGKPLGAISVRLTQFVCRISDGNLQIFANLAIFAGELGALCGFAKFGRFSTLPMSIPVARAGRLAGIEEIWRGTGLRLFRKGHVAMGDKKQKPVKTGDKTVKK